jgi:hypothetical protein
MKRCYGNARFYRDFQFTRFPMFAFERPPHLSFAALDDVKSPRIRQLHDYWKSKCNDVVPPPRSAIEPAEIRALLPYLLLAELSADPFRIFYRLVGTAVVRWHGQDFTGREHGLVTSLAESGIEAAYHRVVKSAAPVFGRTALDAGDDSWIGFDYALFPLSDNGKTVNKCLAINCIGPDAADAPAEDRRSRENPAPSIGGERRHRPLAAPAENPESGQSGQHER